MKREQLLIAVMTIGLTLAGCSGSLPSINLSNAVVMNTEQGVMSGYGVALSGMRAYKALPLCRTGTVATITAPCARRSVIVRLQGLNLRATSAIQRMTAFVVAYPTVDATNVISAASQAITDLRSVLSENGVQ